MLGLLSLIPLKDWLYVGVIVALLSAFGWYTVHERHIGAQHELEAVKQENERVTRAAIEAVNEERAAYANSLTVIQDAYAKLKASSDSQHAADLDRLRRIAADNKGHAVLPSTGGTASKPSDTIGTDGAYALGEVFIRSDVSLALADALHYDDALLTTCRAERDALTGK